MSLQGDSLIDLENQWIAAAQTATEAIEGAAVALRNLRAGSNAVGPIKKGQVALAVADQIVSPLEVHAESFYGKASRNPNYLEWFNFPTRQMVLYTREGDTMSDHDEDGFDDHRCHKKLAPNLEAALAEVMEVLGEAEYFRQGWHVYGGSFNYRRKKLGKSLSMHAYGAAVDMNPGENPLFSKTTTFSAEAVDAMERHGLLWGPRAWGMPGYEGKRGAIYVDPMHFQAPLPTCVRGSYYSLNGWPKNIKIWEPKY